MNTLITQDRLDEMMRLAKLSLTGQGGFFAEVGVYKGGSLKLLASCADGRTHTIGFDTFEGLPKEHWRADELHTPGEFNDTSLEAVAKFVNNPYTSLVKGVFPESAKEYEDLSPWQFQFVHVDTDFYLSVKACIEWFWPRLAPGGIMVFDDYEWPNCPGVKRALDESGLPYQPTRAKYQAFIQKPKP